MSDLQGASTKDVYTLGGGKRVSNNAEKVDGRRKGV